MRSLLLDTVTWDLALDTAGNIAVASDPGGNNVTQSRVT